MAKDTRLDRLFENGSQRQDRMESASRLSLERIVVRKLLDSHGVTALQRKVMESKWQTADNVDFYLSFGWFLDEFSNFPFILFNGGFCNPSASDIMPTTFRSSKLWRIWLKAESEISKSVVGSQNVAVAVSCPASQGMGQCVILHNAYLEDKHAQTHADHLSCVYNRKSGGFVRLQRLNEFVELTSEMW